MKYNPDQGGNYFRNDAGELFLVEEDGQHTPCVEGKPVKKAKPEKAAEDSAAAPADKPAKSK